MLSLLDELIQSGGTDIHLKVPGRPQLRIGDRLVPLPYEQLIPDDTLALARSVLELAREEVPLSTLRDHRVSFGVEGKGRFRAQLCRQRGTLSIVIHRIATDVPALESFGNLEGAVEAIRGSGLILVTGGRSRQQVLASLTRCYLQQIPGHLISIENPIEFLHRDARACISQREVGIDVESTAQGIEASLFQDPNALVVSEVPTAAEAELVLRAAEEGILVIAGLPASEGAEAIRMFARRFPSHREEEVASRVASLLKGVITMEGTSAHWRTLDDDSRMELEAGRVFRPRLVG
jgi:twitching motility protein PilT